MNYKDIDWNNEKIRLEEYIKSGKSWKEIAKIYGYVKGDTIKKKAIKLGIKIINPKTNTFFEYKTPDLICKFCGQKFISKQKLGGHVTFCKLNPKYLNNINNFEEGRNKAHISNKLNKIYNCKFCNKICYNKGALTVHEKACEKNPNREKCPNRIGNGGNAKGHIIWNKGKTMLTDERILKSTQKRKIKNYKPSFLNRHHSEETKELLRYKMIEYVKKISAEHKFIPHYSKNACEYMNKLNEENHWNLQHAENGGEIEICGFFVDGYDKDLNIVFEYDEPRHYINVYENILAEKDINRQNIIINKLNCKFYRYNEKLNKFYCIN